MNKIVNIIRLLNYKLVNFIYHLFYLIEKYDYYLIAFMFIATFVASWLPIGFLTKHEHFLGNTTGYSIITNFIILGKVLKNQRKYCYITQVMVVSLIFSNVYAILCFYKIISVEEYYNWYDRYFLVSFFILGILYLKLSERICKLFE